MLLLLLAIGLGVASCDSQLIAPPVAQTQQVPHVATWMNELETTHRRLRGRSDWRARGGALRVLGKQKLDRIRQRSALSNLDAALLAAKLDSDSELVSRMLCSSAAAAAGACSGGSGTAAGCCCCCCYCRRDSLERAATHKHEISCCRKVYRSVTKS